MKKMGILLMLLFFLSNALAIDLPSPITIQEIDAVVSLQSGGTIIGNSAGGKVTLKVLTFQETPEQEISSLKQVLEINGKKIDARTESDAYGNRYAVFETTETGEFTYLIEADISKKMMPRHLIDFDLDNEITEQAKYSIPTKKIESNDAGLRTLALNRFTSNSWLETIADITNWTHNYVTYDKRYYPETYSAIETLENKAGTCDEFAALSAAILRAKGIPTRIVVGPVFSAQEWNFHGWLEAYNPDSGWIGVDSTYGEAGMVDATHITMGHFPDFTNAADIFIAPAGVSVEVSQAKTVSVTVLSFKPFSKMIAIEAENIELNANSWQDLNIFVQNLVNSSQIVPLEIALPQGFSVGEKSKTIILGPLEKKEVSWQVMIKSDLQKNQWLEGAYHIISLHPRVERTVRVLPEKQQESQQTIKLLDYFATVDGKTLRIEITLENRGSGESEVSITLNSKNKEVEKTVEVVEAQAKKTIVVSVENYESQQYSVSITGPNASYSFNISPKEELPVQPEENPETNNAPQEQSSAQSPAEALLTQENLVLGIIVFSAIAIVFLLKDLVFK